MKKKDPSENEAPVYNLEDSERVELETTEHVETSESPSDSSHGAKIQALEEALKKEKTEALYARAEFDNFRRRTIKERSDLQKYGGERAFSEILTVLDNFERAIAASENSSDEVLRKGIVMIADDLRNTLKRFGVVEIIPEDSKFDPMIFEAISTEETNAAEPGAITRIFRKAYKFHDKVIRPGQAVIAKIPTDSSSKEEKE